jgi:pimeloyl-ACP methyl ester carboxylesterase
LKPCHLPLFAVAAIGAAACSHAPVTTTADEPRFEPLEQCFAEPPAELESALDMDCGYVIVPEARDGHGGRTLKLGIMRLNSGHGTAHTPLFMLAGGPGQAQITNDMLLLFQPQLLGKVLDTRDVVLLEQRGTRNTNTWLDCPAGNSAAWAAHEQGLSEAEAYDLEYRILQECLARFEAQGVDLDNYNSVENAADVDAVRQALGYERILYYGASYGAQLGQHLMRDFPDSLEAVVLDGANSLSRRSWVEDRALDAQWGIDNLARLCQADPVCRDTYDIPALVEAALAVFDAGPIAYSYSDPADPALVVEGVLTAEDLAGLIYELQGSVYGAFGLPFLLADLAAGGVEQTREALGSIKGVKVIESRGATGGGMAMLMHAAMVCSDDPVRSVDEVITDGVGTYAALFGRMVGEEYTALCSLVNVEALPDSTDVNVHTDIPVLLLAGDLDVATPAFRSELVAEALPDGRLMVFPGRTHVQLGSVNRCAFDILGQFLADPAATLDTSCLQEARVLGFVMPDGTMSTEQSGVGAEAK